VSTLDRYAGVPRGLVLAEDLPATALSREGETLPATKEFWNGSKKFPGALYLGTRYVPGFAGDPDAPTALAYARKGWKEYRAELTAAARAGVREVRTRGKAESEPEPEPVRVFAGSRGE